MIGAGLKKYAEELGLECSHGRGWGEYKGYMISLSEGSGYKEMTVAVTFFNGETKENVECMLADAEFKREHRIMGAVVTDSMVGVRFTDTVGTL